jgi:hypothetical protein
MNVMDNSISKIDQLYRRQLSLFSSPEVLGNTFADQNSISRFVHDKRSKRVSSSNLKDFPKIIGPKGGFNRIKGAPIQVTSQDGTVEIFHVYPGTRESLIEECLIHFATNGEFSIEKGEPGYRLTNGRVGVCFTLYQLRKSLGLRNKEYRLDELKEGLSVLKDANYSYFPDEDTDRAEHFGEYIIAKMTKIRNDYPNDAVRSDYVYFVEFTSEVSDKILSGEYRAYDAICSLSMKSPLARYLYKQFTHGWQQANNRGQTGSYLELMQNEVIQASGVPLSTNVTKRRTVLLNALNELVSSGIIQKFSEQDDILPVKNGRKIVDVMFVVRPTNKLIKQQINGFKRLKESRSIGDRNTRALESSGMMLRAV